MPRNPRQRGGLGEPGGGRRGGLFGWSAPKMRNAESLPLSSYRLLCRSVSDLAFKI